MLSVLATLSHYKMHSRNNCSNIMMDHGKLSLSVNNNLPDPKPILDDFNTKDFNTIRFSAYRTACKLLYIQKKSSLHLLDLVNMMEICRQSSLDSHVLEAEIDVGRLRGIFNKMFQQLNLRLPPKDHVDEVQSTEWLLYWLLTAYDNNNVGNIPIFALKIALAVLCCGRITDKLTYIFSLLCTQEGYAVPHLLDRFLHDVLELPRACGEGPSFSYSENSYQDCFHISKNQTALNLDAFLNNIIGDEPGPPALVWLVLMHNIADAENVHHNVHCNSCHRNGFNGFRYKCQQCPNYQSCQECFWKGRVNGRHSLEHEMKESSSTYRSPAKQFGDSLRHSFRRNKNSPRHILIPAASYSLSAQASPEPHKRLAVASSYAPSLPGTLTMYNGNNSGRSPSDYTHGTYGTLGRQPRRTSGLDTSQSQDDEHILIARYAAMLQNQQSGKSLQRPPSQQQFFHQPELQQKHQLFAQPPQAQLIRQQIQPEVPQRLQPIAQDGANKEQIIAELESRNREIMREIARMRKEQMAGSQFLHSTNSLPGSNLVSELKALRQRKNELEQHMNNLQDSRKQLMDQLEIWMKRLKTSHSASARSTPTGSPRTLPNLSSNRKCSTLPRMGNRTSPTPLAERSYGGSQNWQADLLSAADSVTNAMTSLVRELNSEDDAEFAQTMILHGNGSNTLPGRKSVKLYTVPTVFPCDDSQSNGNFSNSPSLDAAGTHNSMR